MAQIKFSNNATTTIALSITEVDTTLTVKAGEGDKFPALNGDDYFIGTLVRGDGGTEIVKVTARVSDTLTIERAQEGSTALAFSANDIFELRLTAGSLETVVNIPDASEAVKGLTQFATEAEVEAVIEDAKAISPLNFGTYMANRTVATPSFSMPASAAEKTVVSGTYTVEDGATAAWSVPAAFVDFNDAGDGTFTFTAPTLDVDTGYNITMTANKTGKLTSQAVVQSITITNVPVQDGPTIVVADTTEGWPGATISGGDIVAPATSAGTNNTNQFVTAKPEVVQTSGNLDLITASTTSMTITETIAEGTTLATDQGTAIAGTVTAGSPVDYTTSVAAQVSSVFSSVYVQDSVVVPNETVVTALGTEIPNGVTASGKLYLIRKENNGDLTPVAEVPYSGTGTGAFQYFTLATPYSIPNDGLEYYFGLQLLTGSYLWDTGTAWIISIDPTLGTSYTPSSNPGFVSCAARIQTAVVDITSAGFSMAPTEVIKATTTLRVGSGITDEYLGPSEDLNIQSSTVSEIVSTSVDSIKDKIYVTNGLHNNLTVDGSDVTVTGISEALIPGSSSVDSADVFADSTGKLLYQFNDSGVALGTDGVDITSGISSYTTGKFGNAALISPTNTLNAPTVDRGTGCTVSWWWKSGVAQTDNAYLWFSGSQLSGIFFGATGSYYYGLRGTSESVPALNGYNDGIWHHIVMTIDSTSEQVYIDGVLKHTTAGATGNLTLVQLGYGAIGQTMAYDQFRVISRKVSSDEVQLLFTETTPDTYATTITIPAQAQAPTTASIPDRCTQESSTYTYTLQGSDLKVTSDKLVLQDEPALKRLAMRVEGTDTTFNTGTIYTEEQI